MANVEISGLTITGGVSPDHGAGIYSLENLTLVQSVVTGNASRFSGGGLSNDGRGTMQITASTISGNFSQWGGGIYNNVGGTLNVTRSTISGNTASLHGGGLYNWFGSATLTDSTVSGNAANAFGGGLIAVEGPLTVRRSTVTDNLADADDNNEGIGGGIAIFGTAAVTVFDHVLVAGNTRPTNRATTSPETLQPTIPSSATAAAPRSPATATSSAIARVRSIRCSVHWHTTAAQRKRTDCAGSPAIDAGDPSAMAGVGDVPHYDQRGNPFGRVTDGDLDTVDRIDIGALENDSVYFIVDTADDNDDGDISTGQFSLREAIAEASSLTSGTPVILFDPEIWNNSILLVLGELAIGESMIIEGPDAEQLTIDAQGDSRVFRINDSVDANSLNVTISGLTLTGGHDVNGGGAIFSQERLTLVDSIVTGNQAQWGGGIYNAEHGELIVRRSLISDNTAVSFFPPAKGSGGGLYNFGGTAQIFDSTITDNKAPDAAGIRNSDNGTLAVFNSTISENIAQYFGGGVSNDGGILTILNSTIHGNSAQHAAGIRNGFGTLTVKNSTISQNIADFSGGGVRNESGNLTIANSTLSGNQAIYGGGLYVVTSLLDTTTVRNSTISGNTASEGGGGIYNFLGHTVIEFSTITNNTALTNRGSGLASWSDQFATLTEVYSSIIAGNVDTDIDIVSSPAPNTIHSNNYNLVGTGNGLASFNQDHDATVSVEDLALSRSPTTADRPARTLSYFRARRSTRATPISFLDLTAHHYSTSAVRPMSACATATHRKMS